MTQASSLEDAADKLGLTFDPAEGALFGARGGWKVSVRVLRFPGKDTLRCEVTGPSVPPDLSLVRSNRWGSGAGAGAQTGDPLFDEQVLLSGPELPALAVLDRGGREAVARLIQAGGQVSSGSILLDLSGDSPNGVEDLVVLVKRCLAVGGAFQGDGQSPLMRLCSHLSTEPLRSVRARILKLLVRDLRGERAVQTAVAPLLRDEDSELRLLAAKAHAGEEARGCLEALLRDEGLGEDDVRPSALDALVASHPSANVSELLSVALSSRATPLVRRGVELTVERRDFAQLPRLRALVTAPDAELKVAVARALGELADVGAEDALIALLEDVEPVQLAAAEVLGELGTLRSVEALLPLSKALTLRRTVSHAALSAIRSIQSRHGTVGHGRLSLVGEDEAAGHLSLPRVREPEG